MARRFAGIMASIGMSVVLFRALKNGNGFESAVILALSWMVTLGLVGVVVGAIAQATVDESVRTKIEQELAGTGQSL